MSRRMTPSLSALCLPTGVNVRIGDNALIETQGTLRWSDRWCWVAKDARAPS
jgi:hypothetical protein